jgi:hypothetical protein
MSNFINDCINGDALMLEIDDYIEKWHEMGISLDLHAFLGMSKKEYELFVQDESYLGLIISAHKESKQIEFIVRDKMAMAARSDNPNKSKQLQKWLESESLWD